MAKSSSKYEMYSAMLAEASAKIGAAVPISAGAKFGKKRRACVNVASVWLYGNAHMWLFTALYVFFFFNAFWGWYEWRKALHAQAGDEQATAT